MINVREKMILDFAKNLTVLVVDDDDMSLDIYKEAFGNIFGKIATAKDGVEAYTLWNERKVKYDLIITDLMMPNMDGFELVNKIRLISPGQHIIILSAIEDVNEMRSIIDLGIDGILVKPYNHHKMFKILSRVLKLIHDNKLLKRQSLQLKLLAKENIVVKTTLHENKIKPKKKKSVVKISKDNKYHTRAHLDGGSAENFAADLDYFDIDRVEVFQDKIEHYQNTACSLINAKAEDVKSNLADICLGLSELIDLLNHFGNFSVTAEATKNLIEFIQNLKIEELEDEDKKDIFVDGLMAILEDLNKWIEMVFVEKNTDNINYFDASFANTCLELESIFAPVILSDEDDGMDFF